MQDTGRGPGRPDGHDDVINKYGTYEVQRTNGTENDYPQIAQGLSREKKQALQKKKENWYKTSCAERHNENEGKPSA